MPDGGPLANLPVSALDQQFAPSCLHELVSGAVDTLLLCWGEAHPRSGEDLPTPPRAGPTVRLFWPIPPFPRPRQARRPHADGAYG